MASTANDGTYGNPAWGGRPQGQPWGNPGWQNQAGPNQSGPYQGQGWEAQGGWTPPPFWYPVGISKPMAILFTILGFIFWWPVGLAILIYMLCTGRMGCRGRNTWQMNGNPGGWQNSGPGWPPFWKAWGSSGPAPNSSSGNHAFDEYKAETLRRLEEEQKEFGAFLDRLRFAKDKAEFDEFMAERRPRQSPPPAPSQEHPDQG